MLYACVLAGGRGERFWPLSRISRPKQLTNLTGDGTMLRVTVDRLLPAIPAERILVIVSAHLADAVAAELPELSRTQIIAEPEGRNSAPAVALGAHWIAARDPDAVFLLAPSDHVIAGEPFRAALLEAAAYAAGARDLVTFGMVPTRPETGYGYIEGGDALSGLIRRATSFREKPDLETARRFLAEGRFFWNSGMFVWHVRTILDAVARHLPDLHALLDDVAVGDDGAIPSESLVDFYGHAPSVSIDYGVMEKADNVAVRVSDFPWFDVGSWSALSDVMPADTAGNVTFGPTKLVDVADSVVYTDGGPIACVGVSGLVVVRVGEVTMVCPKEHAGAVRDLVRALADSAEWEKHL